MREVPLGKVLLTAASVVVLGSVVAGVFVMRSPGEARARRLDQQREDDLRAIADAIDVYWGRHDRIPESLEALTAEPGVRLRTEDPATSEPYGYRVAREPGYELCATFEIESDGGSPGPRDALLAHGPGRQCFQFEPERIERR